MNELLGSGGKDFPELGDQLVPHRAGKGGQGLRPGLGGGEGPQIGVPELIVAACKEGNLLIEEGPEEKGQTLDGHGVGGNRAGGEAAVSGADAQMCGEQRGVRADLIAEEAPPQRTVQRIGELSTEFMLARVYTCLGIRMGLWKTRGVPGAGTGSTSPS